MKKGLLVAGLLMVSSCYAYQIVNIKNYTKEISQQITEESLKLQEKLDARLPVTSKATAGKILRRKIALTSFSYSIFIIGDDAISRQWLQDHSQELEEKNAMGFIANIDSTSKLQELQLLTKVPLLPANVDDLLAILKENHYPIIFHEGEIWQ